MEHLRLESGAQAIAATLYLPADAARSRPSGDGPSGDADPLGLPTVDRLPGLVVGHGAGSRRDRHDPFCRAACAAGLAVLAIDFRGHGESSGVVDGPLHEDILTGVRHLRDHPLVDPTRIGYRGSSMGGYYGVHAAAHAVFAALALICPAGEAVLLEGIERYVDDRRSGGPSDDLASGDLASGRPRSDGDLRLDEGAMRAYLRTHPMLPAAERISCPTLLLHARGDTVVPLADTLALAARLAVPTEVLIEPGGDHRSLQAAASMHARVAEWLGATLRGHRPSAVSGRTGRT